MIFLVMTPCYHQKPALFLPAGAEGNVLVPIGMPMVLCSGRKLPQQPKGLVKSVTYVTPVCNPRREGS